MISVERQWDSCDKVVEYVVGDCSCAKRAIAVAKSLALNPGA